MFTDRHGNRRAKQGDPHAPCLRIGKAIFPRSNNWQGNRAAARFPCFSWIVTKNPGKSFTLTRVLRNKTRALPSAMPSFFRRKKRRSRDSNPGTPSRASHTFQACAFNHSATSPKFQIIIRASTANEPSLFVISGLISTSLTCSEIFWIAIRVLMIDSLCAP